MADPESAAGGSGSTVPPAQSTVPDLEVIRSKAAAALAEEDAKQAEQAGPGDPADPGEAGDAEAPEGAEDTGGTAAASGTNGVKGRLGKLPRPRMRGQLLPAMLRRGEKSQQAQRPAAAKPVKQPLNQRVTVRKPSNASAGLIVAGVLLIVFVIVAIRFVVSFVESVGGIFS
nr:hypothetical protein [Prauserella isguenensis]